MLESLTEPDRGTSPEGNDVYQPWDIPQSSHYYGTPDSSALDVRPETCVPEMSVVRPKMSV